MPVPPAVLDALNLVHHLKALQQRARTRRTRLWPWGRPTAWRRIARVIREARLDGPQATAKGLRHGLGVQAVAEGIPLNIVQKWVGHAQFSTNAVYADAVGAEEHEIASRMW